MSLKLSVNSAFGLRLLQRFLLITAVMFLLSTTAQAQTSKKSKPFETQFWNFLIGNNYKQWAPGPGQDGDFYTGQSPHGALLKMYINRAAASDVKGLKIGSVIVLENYLADRSLKTISVMYRTEGFNPSANDWYWIEYKPDGSVVEAEEEIDIAAAEAESSATAEVKSSSMKLVSTTKPKLMGKASSCIACHRKAEGDDYSFFNDNIQQNTAGIKPQAKPITLR